MTDTITLTDLEIRFLRLAAGQRVEISREEWTSSFMWPAQDKLEAAGLIYKTFEDDQPTAYATEKGEAFLAAQVATAHFGWIYHSPDTGIEWAPQHPVESGEVPDAEDVRAATLEVLHERMTAAWREVHAERRMREVAERRTAPLSPDEGVRAALFDQDAFARAIRTRVTDRGITMQDAAAEIGVHPSILCRITKSGKSPDVENYLRITAWLEAALSTPVPEEGPPRGSASAAERPGWVLVPAKATTAMKDAAQDKLRAGAGMSWNGLSPQMLFAKAWEAMIAAALSAEGSATIAAARLAAEEMREAFAKIGEDRAARHAEAQKAAFEARSDREGNLHHARQVEALEFSRAIRELALPPSSSPEDQEKAKAAATPTIADPDGEARS